MKRVEECVEQIKLAQFSRVPIVWIVVREKEVADQIATGFMNQHLGGRSTFGNSYQLKSLRSVSYDNIPKPQSPSVYFDWIDNVSSKEKGASGFDLKEALEIFLNFYLNIEFEEDVRPCIDQKRKSGEGFAWCRNLAIIASPELPDFGWINSYIETIFVSSLTDEEIRDVITKFIREQGIILDQAFTDQLVVNFRGISERQIGSVLLKCLASEFFDTRAYDKILAQVRHLKKQMLEGFSGLKWINVDSSGPKIAGLDAITNWLNERQQIFSDPEKSIKEGFDIPNGLLVTGIPGTGKSLMAKQGARVLNLPLVAMDLGDIQEGLVGKSEEKMAQALRMVDALAPCVLWIDEIEKAFSGSESGQSDGGVMRRMFGKFLTWMQEKESYCFVLATSNDISKLPPELFRSQRFDEKFYTFMPTAGECAKMLCSNIALQNSRISDEADKKWKIFDPVVFEKEEYWLRMLNELCVSDIVSDGTVTEETVQLDSDGNWLEGYLPQKKLFTGADIAAFISVLKFKILTSRKKVGSMNSGFKGPIRKTEADHFIPEVLGSFMPYGQTNLKDIAACFRSLTKNRFRSASSADEETAIVRFADYDEHNDRLKYYEERFSGPSSRYDAVLYRCIVGAVNSSSRHKNEN